MSKTTDWGQIDSQNRSHTTGNYASIAETRDMSREEFPFRSLQGDILSILCDWPKGEFPSKRQRVKALYDTITKYFENRTVKNLEESKETRGEIKENFNKAMDN